MNWSGFDAAVRAAFHVARDEDIARDAALKAIEECPDDAPLQHVTRRARDRAKDLIRASRRSVQTVHTDVDAFASSSDPAAEALLRIAARKLAARHGTFHARCYHLYRAGHTVAEIAAQCGVSLTPVYWAIEQATRTMREEV